MRYLLVTDTPLPATIVSKAALPGEALTVLCPDRNVARQLQRRGHDVHSGDLAQKRTWRGVPVGDDILVVIALQRESAVVGAVEAVASLLPEAPIVCLESHHDEGELAARETAGLRNVEHVRLTDIVRHPFQEQFANARLRQRVHQYRDHFHAADRVLILLHDDPDPDAVAAALALRALLGRNQRTAIIGAFKAPQRPENVRMCELLGVDVRELDESDLADFDRIAVVDTQPHIFGGRVQHVDLVIDHHPPRTGYTATFKDIRTSFGSTTALLIDYLLRFGLPVSERLATAAVYAIKTDTWTFRRGSVPEDVAIFAQVYPLADQSILRRIESEGFKLESLRLMGEVAQKCEIVGRFLFAHLGEVARDDLVPSAADLLLTVTEAHWTAVSGVLGDKLTLSVRNLGFQRAAGELVQSVYGSLGSAGGHRAAAKAILPLEVARERWGDPASEDFARNLFKPLWEAAGAGLDD